MSRYQMPSSMTEAVSELGTLGELARVTDWKKAAIVAALVGPNMGVGIGERFSLGQRHYPFSPKALTQLGIVGLRSDSTVRRYRDTWFAVRTTAPMLDGSEIDLPDDEFPESESAAVMRDHRQETARNDLAVDSQMLAELGGMGYWAAGAASVKRIRAGFGKVATMVAALTDPTSPHLDGVELLLDEVARLEADLARVRGLLPQQETTPTE